MANGVSIQARIDPQIKEEARGVLDKLGMSMSEAIVVYLKQIIMRRGIPFELKLPNETTIETFKKTDAGKELHRLHFQSLNADFKKTFKKSKNSS